MQGALWVGEEMGEEIGTGSVVCRGTHGRRPVLQT